MRCMDNNKIIYSTSDNLFLFISLLLAKSMKQTIWRMRY